MPIYEYNCPHHGVFEVFHKRIPDKVPQEDACPERALRAAPEGSRMARCYTISPLVLSLGFYGDAQLKAVGRLTRKQRRYHQDAPVREAAERDNRLTRKKTPITRDDIAQRQEDRERLRRSA